MDLAIDQHWIQNFSAIVYSHVSLEVDLAGFAVYLDLSRRDFDLVYPAAGSRTSSVAVTPERLFELVATRWVDLCTLPEPEPQPSE